MEWSAEDAVAWAAATAVAWWAVGREGRSCAKCSDVGAGDGDGVGDGGEEVLAVQVAAAAAVTWRAGSGWGGMDDGLLGWIIVVVGVEAGSYSGDGCGREVGGVYAKAERTAGVAAWDGGDCWEDGIDVVLCLRGGEDVVEEGGGD